MKIMTVVAQSVLMIRIENCADTRFSIRSLITFPLLDDAQKICLIKFVLSGQMFKLAGKCPVTGHYHKHCIVCTYMI